MARDAIDRCKVCGTPYLSALKEGETDADRICYTCHPSGPSGVKAPADGSSEEEFVLAENDDAPKRGKHVHGDARQQIVRQIRSAGKIKPQEAELPADAPDLPPRQRQAYASGQGSPLGFMIKVLILAAIPLGAGYFAYQTYTKSQEEAQKAADKAAVPPVPVPEPPPAPIPVAVPRPKQLVVKQFKPEGVDIDEVKRPTGPTKLPEGATPRDIPPPDQSKLPLAPPQKMPVVPPNQPQPQPNKK